MEFLVVIKVDDFLLAEEELLEALIKSLFDQKYLLSRIVDPYLLFTDIVMPKLCGIFLLRERKLDVLKIIIDLIVKLFLQNLLGQFLSIVFVHVDAF